MKRGRLIALDGVDGAAIRSAAREVAAGEKRSARAGVSHWDASGVFGELSVGEGGFVSPRVLLLLYAADLAFRLRWEIAPAIDEGRTVIAAPSVQTAIAFGRAVGLPHAWLANLFRFAPQPNERRVVEAPRAKGGTRDGFVGVLSDRGGKDAGISRARISRAMAAYLRPRRAPR